MRCRARWTGSGGSGVPGRGGASCCSQRPDLRRGLRRGVWGSTLDTGQPGAVVIHSESVPGTRPGAGPARHLGGKHLGCRRRCARVDAGDLLPFPRLRSVTSAPRADVRCRAPRFTSGGSRGNIVPRVRESAPFCLFVLFTVFKNSHFRAGSLTAPRGGRGLPGTLPRPQAPGPRAACL